MDCMGQSVLKIGEEGYDYEGKTSTDGKRHSSTGKNGEIKEL